MAPTRAPEGDLERSATGATVRRALGNALAAALLLLWPALAGAGDDAWMPRILTGAAGDVYLPDWSYAGYHWGEVEPPQPAATLDATDFGAIPDDGGDDTRALLAALAAAQDAPGRVVLELPPGRLILRDILAIRRSDLVLRGAGSGPDGTVLFIPIALEDLRRPASLDELQEYLIRGDKREKTTGEPFSVYSWAGGFIWPQVPGKRVYPYLAELDMPAEVLARALSGRRGGHEMEVDRAAELPVGDTVRIEWYNIEGERGSLLEHLYMSTEVPIGSRHWENPARPLIFQDVTVTAIEGDRVTIKEPLLHDLRPAWGTVLTRTALLEEVGIEGLRIEFPESRYGPHHLEAGRNAIYLTSLRHGWVRDVTIINADSAILSDDVSQTTIEDVRIEGRPAHYGIHIGRTSGVLARRIEIAAAAQHPLSFNTYAKASVFSDVDLLADARLDQHRGTNHQNLFDDVRIVEASRRPLIFKHGGASYWRPTHGAFNTLWNIQITFTDDGPADGPIELKGEREGPHARIVGFAANREVRFSYGPDAYLEGINRPGIAVPSLYQYQLRERLMR